MAIHPNILAEVDGGEITRIVVIAAIVVVGWLGKVLKTRADKRQAEEQARSQTDHEARLRAMQAQRAQQAQQVHEQQAARETQAQRIQPTVDPRLAMHARSVMRLQPTAKPSVGSQGHAELVTQLQAPVPPMMRQPSAPVPRPPAPRAKRQARAAATAGPAATARQAAQPTPQAQPPALPADVGDAFGLHDIHQARLAIIYREILGPPKALRQDSEIWDT